MQEQFGYAYDAAGNLNYRTNNALVQTFAANNLNELSTATRSGTLTVAGGTSGAATNVTVNGSAASRYGDNTFALAGFTVTNGNNAYTAIAQDSYGRKDTNSVNCNLPSSVSFVYDSNGNLTSDGSRGFDYDDENQLVRVTVTNSWKSEFTYDGKMRRRIRKEFAWQNSMWVCTGEVRYIYDGKVVIQERDGNNLPAVTYTRGRDLSSSLQGAGGIGGLLARTDQQSTLNNQLSTSYYHADGNGNVTAMVNLQQLVVGRYVYDPFGNILSKSGPLADANTYRFSSQEYHQPSGLSLYLYRAYDPNLQRWLNPDPIQEGGGINLYRFVGNNPINWVDPLGLLDYYYSGGGLLTPSGPVPYLEGETLPGQLGASMYNAVPLAFNFLFGGLLNIGTAEGAASVHGRSTVPTVNALADDALAVASVIPGEGVLPKVACEARTATRIAQAAKVTRAINLPGWKNLTVDMTHIAERHMTGGPFTQGRTIFANLNEQGVMAAIKQAYGSATTVAVQGDRVLLSGTTKAGMIVEMWLNKATKVIETAYPVVP